MSSRAAGSVTPTLVATLGQLVADVTGRLYDRYLREQGSSNTGMAVTICDGPNHASYFRFQHVDAPHALVYRSIRHPHSGSPIDIADPDSPSRVQQRLRDAGTYVDFTWALVLNGLTGETDTAAGADPG